MELRDKQKKEVLVPSDSPWAFRVVLDEKNDGLTRFCVDNWMMNNVRRKDSYSLPRIHYTLDISVGSFLTRMLITPALKIRTSDRIELLAISVKHFRISIWEKYGAGKR